MGFYTVNEVCKKFNITRATLNRYMKLGKIEYLKTGTSKTCKVLFERHHIDNFIKSLNRKPVNITKYAEKLGTSRMTIYNYWNKYGKLPKKEDLKI